MKKHEEESGKEYTEGLEMERSEVKIKRDDARVGESEREDD